jgi:hypothetical protein
MSWIFGGWKNAKDGSSMKVSDSHGALKTERISSTRRPHDHQIVKVDRPSGRVKEISVWRSKKK